MAGIRQGSRALLQHVIGWDGCRRCGACCRDLIIEAGPVDVLREPLIAERCPVLDGNGSIEDPTEWSWSIAVGMTQPCPFLGPDNACSIYATRPHDCVAFAPGGKKCIECRAEEGLI